MRAPAHGRALGPYNQGVLISEDLMRRLIPLLALAFAVPGLRAQEDPKSELLRRIDQAIEEHSKRMRAELLESVRGELRGQAEPKRPVASPPPAAGALDAAKALVTVDLLKKHASFLASDELEGRAAGYPGNEKASEYIAGVFKDAGLKPAGDAGTYFQKFKVAGRDTRNVVALLEGADAVLKKEYVVVGAHFDHVGTAAQEDFGRLGGRGEDKIWNGADDNGSGTTTLLGVARAFGEGKLRPRRSVVFIAFSGEEAGLIGSRWYTNHPIGTIAQHAFMLNLDMVGRNPTRPMEIHGVGSGEGGVVRKVVEQAVEASGLKATLNDGVKLVGGDSDHSSFEAKKVPYAFFFSGFHADYHRPSDHPDKLAYDNMVKVAHTAVHILLGVADLGERPRFVATSKPRLNLPDFQDPSAPPPRRMGVTVQELDEKECDALKLEKTQGGLRVDAVQAGGPAEAAGVKAGDVILAVAGVTLPRGGTRDRLRTVLAELIKPGKEVEVVVLRNGDRFGLKANWKE
jgi:hypothetical protein